MEPFLGEVILFAGNFAPRDWALCNGQLLAISQNSALFSILGTTYGGDGRTTFALPDLRGRAPIHAGRGAGLSDRILGSRSGAEITTLTALNLPSHNHSISAAEEGNTDVPNDNYIAGAGLNSYSTVTDTASKSTGNTGNSQAFNNMPPYLVMNYIIALQGIFPSRN
ncbi:tail fiber protein [Gillisia sp. M10.2A]|uniref:Tail fiber protein n=1 Tax=Gillisia lutea TaxID=2909668 RepID=A0ABS9EB14_9FLAO|nr:tail fiber protein [Gillisia lutea]